MSFRVTGLSPEPFRALYGLSDEALSARGVRRLRADQPNAFPDRVEVRDLDPGEPVLLLNWTHQPADTPFRASHAIFVREGAERALDVVDQVPEALARRPLSLRAFDAGGEMVDADLCDGADATPFIERLLRRADTAYVHAHYARRGCYAALIQRA